MFAQGAAAVGERAGGGSVGENAVYARGAEFVVAFGIDEEAEGGVEVAGGFADGALFGVGGGEC